MVICKFMLVFIWRLAVKIYHHVWRLSKVIEVVDQFFCDARLLLVTQLLFALTHSQPERKPAQLQNTHAVFFVVV